MKVSNGVLGGGNRTKYRKVKITQRNTGFTPERIKRDSRNYDRMIERIQNNFHG